MKTPRIGGEGQYCLTTARLRLITAVFAFLIILCSPYPGRAALKSDVWGVLVVSNPDKIVLEKEGETVVSYILRQTHEPLFRKADGQNFSSRILKKWSRNLNNTEFAFCPDTGLKFDGSASFSLDFFYSYISSVTAEYSRDFSMGKGNGCAVIRFPVVKKGYLDFLTRYDKAPSVNPDGNIARGLGPFFVSDLTDKKVELRRKITVSGGYNRIVFYAYSAADDELKNSGISDYNKLSSSMQPNWLSRDFQGFWNIELLSAGLAINHPDKRVRGMLFNCIDVKAFREAFAPVTRKQFFDIQTVLPIGVPGAQAGKIDQRCEAYRNVKAEDLVLVNSKTNNLATLAKFTDDFYRKTGVRIKVRNFPPNQINPMLYDNRNHRPYNLIVLAAGALGTEVSEFLKLYSGTPLALDYVPGHVRQMFRRITSEENLEKKEHLALNLANELNKEFLVLPLYQSAGALYYPRKIKNLSVGHGAVEYPEVADLRW